MATDVVKQIRRRTRRKFSADEKIRIVLEGLRGEIPITELCRQQGIQPSIYYKWSKAFLASRSAISLEPASWKPLKIIKRMPARARRSFSKSSSMSPSLPHSHSAAKGASTNSPLPLFS